LGATRYEAAWAPRSLYPGIGLDALYYDVTFEDVVMDRQVDPAIDGFRFLAPTTSATIDLATEERLPLPRDRTR
jgi:hypothetical protein